MEFVYVTDDETLRRACGELSGAPFLFLDTETAGERVRLVQLGDREKTYVVDLYEIEDITPLRELLSKKGVVGHNLKFDLKYLSRLGIRPPAVFDTMIASYLLGYERHSLSHLVASLLGYSLDKSYQLSDWDAPVLSDAQLRYAAKDVDVLREIFPKLLERLNGLDGERGQELLKSKTAKLFGLRSPVSVVEMAFVKVLAEVELNGFPVDEGKLSELLSILSRETQKRVQSFIIKYRTDPLSQKALAKLLSERFRIPLPRTPKGNLSTDDTALSEFVDIPPVREVLEIRRLKKLTDKLRELKEALRDGRVYPEFRQIGAVTGRMSCSNPNVQNVPRELRKVFRTREGRVFVVADFSQIELRIAAELVGDPLMVRAFREGKDLHRFTASLVLGKREEEVSEEERRLAKAINFGLIYGISARGLSRYARLGYGVELEEEEAKRLRERFFSAFKAFRDWHEEVKRELKQNGEVRGRTLLGRRFVATTFNDAVNYPVQGTGADLLKLAVLLFDGELKRRGLGAMVVNLVHDEIVAECDEEEAQDVKEVLLDAMKRAGRVILRSVPVEVECVISRTWEK
ncbi:MAG: bifunctional 3'-5' exonuclease/DNA polymerase [Aquificae bacterium]|nr:bifunctional 3'-5' exonuclease/DNA polymerase [Aquificota bacterium]